VPSSAERAAIRASTWSAEVVGPREPKGASYGPLTIAERLAAFVALNRRAWEASGRRMPEREPRREWPGEILELRRNG
jgi:hypothetical protein